MNFNYNVNPIDFGAYYQGLNDYQKRQANDLVLQQQQATTQQQAQLQPLVQSYLGGDTSALNKIAAIDSGKAAELQKLVDSQKKAFEDPFAKEGFKDIEELFALGSNGSQLFTPKLETMLQKYQGTPYGESLTQWSQQLQQDPTTAMQALANDVQVGRSLLAPKEDKTQLEFLKEERQVARSAVDNFNKRTQDVRSSYGKIEGLLQKEKLTRADIASGITALARLNSPGIVTDFDFSSLAGGQDPVAFAIERLRGAGMDDQSINQLNAFYDPTNPNLFNKDAFLQTAKAVAGAEMPALIDAYEMARERALSAGISEERIKAIFDGNRNYQFAKGFTGTPKRQAPQLSGADKDAYDWAMKNPNDPRSTQIKQRLGVQ